jgi:LysM repeat protein
MLVRWGIWVVLLLGMNAWLSAQSVTYRVYSAREGEHPAEIAQRFGIPISELLQVNPNLVADQPLRAGEVLLIPLVTSSERTRPTQRISTPSPSSSRPIARAYWIYTVKAGESLSAIARRFGIPTSVLQQVNGLTSATVTPGQVLMVPILEQSVGERTDERKQVVRQKQTTLQSRSLPRRLPSLPAPRIFGYVGTVIASSVAIRSSPRLNAPVWSRCGQGTQLVIVDERPDWWGVLMINGATGWVPKKALIRSDRAIYWDDLMAAFRPFDGRLDGQAIVQDALRYLGVPYRYGGNSPVSGLDCSAFVQQVFARRGIRLPRTAAEQARIGIPVSFADLRPGDRLYFAIRGGRIDHCGIYIGNGLFIHASGRHDAVVISSLSEPLYARRLVAIRRD